MQNRSVFILCTISMAAAAAATAASNIPVDSSLAVHY